MESVYIPSGEINVAIGLHTQYIDSLDYYSYWLETNSNKDKIKVFSAIEKTIELKNRGIDSGNEVFPSIRTIQSDLIDKVKYDKFSIGLKDFDFSNPFNLGEGIIDNVNNFGGHKNLRVYVEYRAFQLVFYLGSKMFLEAFEEIPKREQGYFINWFSDRLSESITGNKFLIKNQIFINHSITPIFHYSRIESEIDYLIEQLKNHDGSFKYFADGTPILNKVIELIGIVVKYSPLICNKYLIEENKTLEIRIIRKQILRAYKLFIHVIDESLDEISDSLEKWIGFDIDLDDNAEKAIQELKKELNKSFPKDANGNIRLDKRGLFNKTILMLNMISLSISVYSLLTQKDKKFRNGLDVFSNLTATLEAIEKISSKKVVSQSLGIGKNFGKNLVTAGSVAGILVSGYDFLDTLNEEDTSQSIGYASQVASGIIFVVWTASNPFGWALFFIGLCLILWTKDAKLNRWFRYNYFGLQWAQTYDNAAVYSPMDLQFGFKNDYNRQVIKYESMLSGGTLSANLSNIGITGDWGLGPNNDNNLTSNFIKIREDLDAIDLDWNDEYKSLDLVIEEQTILAKRIELTFKFWDNNNREFFWESNHNHDKIVMLPLEESALLPSEWQNEDFVFVRHKKLKTEEKDDSAKIETYKVEFFVKKSFLNVPNRLSHIEVYLDFKDIDSQSKTLLVLSSEV